MLKNPLLNALLGGLAAALAVAGPLVDDGVLPSEGIAIALAFLSGTGLTAVPNRVRRVEGKHRADDTYL